MELPPELWDLIFQELSKINLEQVAKYKVISKYFNELISDNKFINYRLILCENEGDFYIDDIFTTESDSNDRIAHGHFRWACENDRLEIAKWLAQNFEMFSGKNEDRNHYIIKQVCRNGYLEVLQWLVSRPNISIEDERKYDILEIACEEGHVEIVRWLNGTFEFSPERIVYSKFTRYKCSWTIPLRRACKNGHLETARYLVEAFDAANDEALYSGCRSAFFYSCKYGHLEVAKWLFNALDLQPCNVNLFDSFFQRRYYRALYHACIGGYLEIAKWLVDTFGLTLAGLQSTVRGEISCDVVTIFNVACMEGGGTLDILKWLHSTFDLTDEINKGTIIPTLFHKNQAQPRSSTDKARLEIAQWLADTFDLTRNHSNKSINKTLRSACEYGYLDIVEWLVNTFNITTENIKSKNNYAIVKACKHGHFDIVRWMMDKFNL